MQLGKDPDKLEQTGKRSGRRKTSEEQLGNDWVYLVRRRKYFRVTQQLLPNRCRVVQRRFRRWGMKWWV